MKEKFIARFFPPSRFISEKSAIATFSQGSNEPFYETWERFKSLLRRYPNHSFDDAAQLHIFYSGLKPQTKMILDSSTKGTMMAKSPDEAIVIIDSIVASDYQSHHDRAPIQRKGIMELDTQNASLAHNKLLALQKKLLIPHLATFSALPFFHFHGKFPFLNCPRTFSSNADSVVYHSSYSIYQ